MRKFLHMAGGIAKKTLATAAKLAKKLAHIVLQAAGAAVSAVSSAASAGAVRFAHMRPVSSREMSFFMTGVLSETGEGDTQKISTGCG